MQVKRSAEVLPLTLDPAVYEVLVAVSMRELQDTVTALSVPRHVEAHPQQNTQVRKHLTVVLRSFGYDIQVQGHQFNVMAAPADYTGAPCTLIGAHYDSAADTPGAADNATGVAVLLACARILQQFRPSQPVLFAFFNAWQDQEMPGSAEFVASLVQQGQHPIRQVHIIDTVGVCHDRPFTQKPPPGLGAGLPDRGDFLGLLSNWHSQPALEAALRVARTYVPDFPVVGMNAPNGPAPWRTDHLPFWRASIPALLWTDTGEYRNPHHRRPTDTPDRLDYTYMSQVLLLLLACCLHR